MFGLFTRPSTTEWEVYDGDRAVTLIDGTRSRSPLMRRRVKGEWQYRKMNAAEESDYVKSRAGW